MALFEEYKNHPDPFVRERANNWAIAIGLQRVDGLMYLNVLIIKVSWIIESCE